MMRSKALLLCAGAFLAVFGLVLGKKASDGPCDVCQSFVESFEVGLRDTEDSNFAGGDTSWEEKNQPVYANSEVRLIEILESVCGGNDYKCTRFLDRYEEDIEKWWLKLRRNGHKDLEQWLCFDHLKVCCPKGTYGPDCKDCPGGRERPCNGHGTCKGSGEVDGSGGCRCDDGYKGKECESCKDGYYNDEGECKACDESCKSTCSGSGPERCDECAEGFTRLDDEEDGECEDIDECEDELAKCDVGTYCYNTPGSYQCKECDKSCKGACTGRGPSGCLECAEGYEDKSGYCMDINECSEGLSDCTDGYYCHNTQGSFECKECDESCLMSCTKAGPSGCDVCKEGYTMNDNGCEDLNECSSYPPPCDETSEFCSNTKGSYTCKCKAGFTRVEGKCVSWDEADDIRAKKLEKKAQKKPKKKPGKKQQPIIQEQDKMADQPVDADPENDKLALKPDSIPASSDKTEL